MTRLSSFAAQTLQRQIHEGHYRPGASLPGQRELSDVALGISRTVLREAGVDARKRLALCARSRARASSSPPAARRAANCRWAHWTCRHTLSSSSCSIIEPAAAALMARNASDTEIAALQVTTQARMQTALHALDPRHGSRCRSRIPPDDCRGLGQSDAHRRHHCARSADQLQPAPAFRRSHPAYGHPSTSIAPCSTPS